MGSVSTGVSLTSSAALIVRLLLFFFNFAWSYDFPEPGLNEALQKLKGVFDIQMKEAADSVLPKDIAAIIAYLTVVCSINDLFKGYKAPLDEIDERFERLGMGFYYQVLVKPQHLFKVRV